jgi:hypothetical protein
VISKQGLGLGTHAANCADEHAGVPIDRAARELIYFLVRTDGARDALYVQRSTPADEGVSLYS